MAQSPTTKVSAARIAAFDAFIAVIDKGRKPDEALEELYDASPTKRLDRNLAKEILYGSLRWYSKIFWILQHTSSRDLTKTSTEVRAALICGTYQIFYMDRIPDRAAVNESAEYIRYKSQAPAVSFVNGILRQIARRSEYFTKPDKKTKPVEYLALQFAHPEWLVRRWLNRFRFEKMETMLAVNNTPPPLYVRVNAKKTPLESILEFQQQLLREEHIQSDRGSLKSALLLKKWPPLEPESLFGQGYFTIQDQASQIIPHLLQVEAGDTIVDAACGPGGKLTHILELARGPIQLIGVEKHPGQMQRAKETAARLGHTEITWVEQDFLEFEPKLPIDKVLLDAPCSGLGVLRKHPEGKWLKSEKLIFDMANEQRTMIKKALSMLKRGGTLVYSVCSFEPEEGLDHVTWLEKDYRDQIEVVSPTIALPDYFKRYVTRENVLMIYSGNQDDMEGFTSFVVRKKG